MASGEARAVPRHASNRVAVNVTRAVVTVRAIGRELAGYRRLASDRRSFLRLSADVILYRVLRVVSLPNRNRRRRVRVHGGIELTYRLNRGDLLVLRETWVDEVYRLPFDRVPRTLLDLGANIGLTTVWLTHNYGCEEIVAVEPLPANAELLRSNLQANNIPAQVVEAAVGPTEELVNFAPAVDHSAGKLVVNGGIEVRVVNVDRLLKRFKDPASVDLLKLDIEGGEEELLSGDRAWLAHIDSIIVEFHPWMVDYPGLVSLVECEGFQYIPAGSAHPNSMDAFIRQSPRERSGSPG